MATVRGYSEDEVTRFWAWFRANRHRLFNFESDRDTIFEELGEALAKVHPRLGFEFGPISGGGRELVISACGIREAFPAVQQLVAGAPPLDEWRITAFRPRRDPLLDLSIGGQVIRAADVRVIPEPDGSRIGLTVLLPGYRPTAESTFEELAYLFLDQALGEYTVETRIGFIEVGAVDDFLDLSIPLHELASKVDAWRAA